MPNAPSRHPSRCGSSRSQGRAAYSTTMLGLRPFDISLAPIDQLSAELMIERKPALTDLPMNAPQAEQQIVSGVYQLESGQWRWMSQTATILLKPPDQPNARNRPLHHPRRIARAPGDHRAERPYGRVPNLLRSRRVFALQSAAETRRRHRQAHHHGRQKLFRPRRQPPARHHPDRGWIPVASNGGRLKT